MSQMHHYIHSAWKITWYRVDAYYILRAESIIISRMSKYEKVKFEVISWERPWDDEPLNEVYNRISKEECRSQKSGYGEISRLNIINMNVEVTESHCYEISINMAA